LAVYLRIIEAARCLSHDNSFCRGSFARLSVRSARKKRRQLYARRSALSARIL